MATISINTAQSIISQFVKCLEKEKIDIDEYNKLDQEIANQFMAESYAKITNKGFPKQLDFAFIVKTFNKYVILNKPEIPDSTQFLCKLIVDDWHKFQIMTNGDFKKRSGLLKQQAEEEAQLIKIGRLDDIEQHYLGNGCV